MEEDFYMKVLILEKHQTTVETFDDFVTIQIGNTEVIMRKSQARKLYNDLGEKLYQVRPEDQDGFFDFLEVI